MLRHTHPSRATGPSVIYDTRSIPHETRRAYIPGQDPVNRGDVQDAGGTRSGPGPSACPRRPSTAVQNAARSGGGTTRAGICGPPDPSPRNPDTAGTRRATVWAETLNRPAARLRPQPSTTTQRASRRRPEWAKTGSSRFVVNVLP
jgi:hypothetical protein